MVTKGRMVEKIVASMHEGAGVSVETNQWLPPTLGNGTQKREIDVLITTSVAGYPVRLAIECKNEKTPAGSPDLGIFIDKLNHVGIPPQQGIFVSVTGFTKGALERAKATGVRCLLLSDVGTKLGDAVVEAFQSVLYLLASVESFVISNTASPADVEYRDTALVFFDEEEKPCGMVQDLIWYAWKQGKIPDTIGVHEVTIDVPETWHQRAGAKTIQVMGCTASVRVRGVVITLKGEVSNHALLDAETRTMSKWQLEVRFPKVTEQPRISMIESEDEVETAVASKGAINIGIGRIRLPRIIQESLYWPPSKRALDLLSDRVRRFEAGEIPDPRPSGLAEIEGTDFATIFEPIWEGHPAGRTAPADESGAPRPTAVHQRRKSETSHRHPLA